MVAGSVIVVKAGTHSVGATGIGSVIAIPAGTVISIAGMEVAVVGTVIVISETGTQISVSGS